MDGIEEEELPVRPDFFSFNTVIQQWARSGSGSNSLGARGGGSGKIAEQLEMVLVANSLWKEEEEETNTF